MQSRFFIQHKKLNIDETFSKKDVRKGDKQGELFIWDPIDEVPEVQWMLSQACVIVWSYSSRLIWLWLQFLYECVRVQKWYKHYCVIENKTLYYAEENEQQEEDVGKVNYWSSILEWDLLERYSLCIIHLSSVTSGWYRASSVRALVSRAHVRGQTDGRETAAGILCRFGWSWRDISGAGERHLRQWLHPLVLVM